MAQTLHVVGSCGYVLEGEATMSPDSLGSGRSEVPIHPFEQLWYLQGEAEAQGPCKGYLIKEMIEAGSVRAASLVAKVGATAWSAIADVPAFAACLPVRAVRYAGFWIRALAFLIDLILQCILFLGLATVMGLMSIAMNTDTGADRKAASVALGFFIIALILASALFYNVYPPSSRWQATPGKRIWGIHLIREDGGRVSGALALGRCLAYFVSSLTLGLGFFMIGWTGQKKGLHDVMCGTRVVYGRP
jgi:uncharacterized RDD family membrane protein YckC